MKAIDYIETITPAEFSKASNKKQVNSTRDKKIFISKFQEIEKTLNNLGKTLIIQDYDIKH